MGKQSFWRWDLGFQNYIQVGSDGLVGLRTIRGEAQESLGRLRGAVVCLEPPTFSVLMPLDMDQVDTM